MVSLAAALFAAAVVARSTLETTTLEGIITIHGYDHETLLAITSVGIAVLAAMALRRALRFW